MVKHITPSLGMDLDYVGGKPYYDANSTTATPAVGTVVKADDGHDYIFATASAAVASGAVVILTEPAMTFATGAGAWTAPAQAIASGDYAWLKRTAI